MPQAWMRNRPGARIARAVITVLERKKQKRLNPSDSAARMN
jgi:hypothetical protein